MENINYCTFQMQTYYTSSKLSLFQKKIFSAAPYFVWSGSISQDVCVCVCPSVSVLFDLGGLVTQTILTVRR